MEPTLATMAAEPPSEETLQVRFTGSGSEYFRIWIVNLLLMLVTLGLYYPWARVRRLRYFASNTWIGNARIGEHALTFGGDPKRMLRGYAVMVGLLLLYGLSDFFSKLLGIAAFMILLACIPLLTWASLRFRLGNTRWRGIRFAFAGTLLDAYRAYLPVIIAALVSTLLAVVFSMSFDPESSRPGGAASLTPLLLLVLMGTAWLLCLFRLVRYRQDHLRFGNLQTRLNLGAGAYVGLLIKTGLLSILLMILLGLAFGIFSTTLGAALGGLKRPGSGGSSVSAAFIFMILLAGLLASLSWQVLVRAWLQAREQNLVWSHTAGDNFHFDSQLSTAAYVRRSLLNGLLLVLTLGFYQPFASVALARLRLDAVSITSRGNLDDIVATAEASTAVAGDAGADVFGVDIGL